eukprot:3036258-Rhodomonas_salina.1
MTLWLYSMRRHPKPETLNPESETLNFKRLQIEKTDIEDLIYSPKISQVGLWVPRGYLAREVLLGDLVQAADSCFVFTMSRLLRCVLYWPRARCYSVFCTDRE